MVSFCVMVPSKSRMRVIVSSLFIGGFVWGDVVVWKKDVAVRDDGNGLVS